MDKNNGQVNTSYDAMGRAASRTNPFTSGGTPGPATTYQYDLTNKATITTMPGGNTVRSDYSGSTVTVTDQVNRKIKRESDGLGRLIKVTEQDVAAGTLTQETSYSYSLEDKLTGVNQGGQLRSYKYDAMGKLLYDKIPEQSATINDGTGTMWSSKYTYTEWGGLANKQDARGVITSYAYDSLHRVTQVSYNTVSGVTTAPTVTYVYDYDVNWNTTAAGKLLRVNVGSEYQERYTFDGMLRASSAIRTIGSRTYTTSYNSYNDAGQLTQMTYPSTRQVSFTHDNAGRFNGLPGYVSNIGYNVAGQVTGDTLGNGVVETYGYDANRLQLTSQTATRSGNTLMNLTYGYNATAGQMGSGSTAGNSGQLMTISGTIGGSTESAGYSYDNLGRLLTSNQTSNGSTAQRRFDYDRWGNRTGMWDLVSGGNQIQSLALEQSGGVPTNRIQFNLPPGTNVALASNGATATVSSTYSGGGSYPASGVINGDRKGANWGSGGGWNDDTANTYPDWVQVSFNGSKTINEIDVFTLQDNYASPSEPTETMTFSQYGIVDFKVQYWDGSAWTAVSGGVVTGNNKVWRKFTFSSLTTDKIRVRATNALSSYSRVTELEAYQVVTPAYDAAGNVTNDGVHTYEYDSENRMVSVDGGLTASSAYDNQNRRYKKTIGSTVTHYVWEGSHVLAEHNGSTGAVLIDYIYSGSRMIAKVASGSTQYFLSDRLSARLTLDPSGNVLGRQSHLPFGEDFGESGTQHKQHFTSYEGDGESGTDYAVNRQYSQGVGRFTRPDPLARSARKDTPQTWNRYSYGVNEPVDVHDPEGLETGWGSQDPFAPVQHPPVFLPPWDLDPCSPNGASYLLDGFDMNVGGMMCLSGPVPSPNPEPEPPPTCNIAIATSGRVADDIPLSFPLGDPKRIGEVQGPINGWYFNVFFAASVSDDVSTWTLGQTLTGTLSFSGYYTSTGKPFSTPELKLDSNDPVLGGERFFEGLTKIQRPGDLWMFALDSPGWRRQFVHRDVGEQVTVTNLQLHMTFRTSIRKGKTECGIIWQYDLTVTNSAASFNVRQTGRF